MAGIYIHIPFCKQACNYCDFHFSTSLRFKNEMLAALQKELELQQNYLDNTPLESIYFGGGTPSLLSAQELESLLNTIQKYHPLNSDIEITLEANPDDLSKEKLKSLYTLGINRLSIGIQSFRQEDLAYMNRAHTALEAEQCLYNAAEVGFKNYSLDLIYAIPGSNMSHWQKNLEKALSFPVNHISAYCLTVEKNTALFHLVKEKKSPAVNEQEAEEQFLWMCDFLKAKHFVHYEVSNFGKEQFFSRHNTSYWLGKKYLGIGPSAHSFNKESRQYNIANNKRYIDAIQNNKKCYEHEFLSVKNQFNEYLMIGLRTMWGVNEQVILKRFGEDFYSHFQSTIQKPEIAKHIIQQSGNHVLNQSGLLFADRIATELFLL